MFFVFKRILLIDLVQQINYVLIHISQLQLLKEDQKTILKDINIRKNSNETKDGSSKKQTR